MSDTNMHGNLPALPALVRVEFRHRGTRRWLRPWTRRPGEWRRATGNHPCHIETRLTPGRMDIRIVLDAGDRQISAAVPRGVDAARVAVVSRETRALLLTAAEAAVAHAYTYTAVLS